MAIRSQLRLEQLTGSIDDGTASNDPTGAGTVTADSLQGVLNAVGESIQKVHGFAGGFNIAAAGEFAQTITPDAANSKDLGSAAKEWRDLYLADELFFGTGQNVKLKQDAGGVILSGSAGSAAAALFFKDTNSFIAVTGPSNNVLEIQNSGEIKLDTPLVKLEDDNSSIQFGVTNPASIAHVSATGNIRLTNEKSLEFGAATEFIGEISAGVVEVGATTRIDLDATAVNIVDNKITATAALQLQGASNANDVEIGLAGGANGAKIMSDKIKGSDGNVRIEFDGAQNVVIPGSLTVMGEQTVIDTTDLIVEDRKIGLNYTSGSKAGGAAQVGFVFGQAADADTPALVFNNSTQAFRLYLDNVGSTSGSFDATSLAANAAAARLDVGEIRLFKSRKVYGDGTNEALELTTGNDPDVLFRRSAILADTRQIKLGEDVPLKKYGIAAQTGQNELEFSGSFGGGYAFKLAQDVNGTASKSILNVVGTGIQVQAGTGADALITAFAGANQHIKLSGSAGESVKLHGSSLLKLTDHFRDKSTWSDADGISLAGAAADWIGFRSSFGEVSLLAAITAAGGGAGTLQKKVVAVTGSGYLKTPVPMALDLDSLTKLEVDERLDVYVNGQLLHSGTANVGAVGTGDYELLEPRNGASVNAVFKFNLSADDIVTAVVR